MVMMIRIIINYFIFFFLGFLIFGLCVVDVFFFLGIGTWEVKRKKKEKKTTKMMNMNYHHHYHHDIGN
ncbi:hypothetical protein CARUB_v10018358mg [Capsella rubella]|uniref:Uncharacterized protein n=1 Tax=Capsella rubella TaxID=81985 RepID=R0FR68_9BRAS|nr:hypothetical protein CARUB_v10018358mg [Capsella rubella]